MVKDRKSFLVRSLHSTHPKSTTMGDPSSATFQFLDDATARVWIPPLKHTLSEKRLVRKAVMAFYLPLAMLSWYLAKQILCLR